MKYHYEIEQGSEEWRVLRMAKITGSTIKPLLVKGKGESGFGVGAITHLLKCVEEKLTGTPRESFSNKATDWGHEYEPEARNYYEAENFIATKQCGFIEKNEWIGASPDSLIGDDGGLEVKCLPVKHIEIIDSNQPIADQVLQAQFNMWVSGRKWWDLVYYHPNMPDHLKMKVFRQKADKETFKVFEERTQKAIIFIKNRLKRYGKQN